MLALFLGLLKIAEDAGIVYALVRLVRPILRPLFPDVPPDHPALGMIALNLTATVFGLGNAATPFGIKAMEELQTLNRSEDTATNAMVMLLAINTASLQLVPPVLLLALMGTQINTLIFPILTTTVLGLIVAIVAARLLGRLPDGLDLQVDPDLVAHQHAARLEGRVPVQAVVLAVDPRPCAEARHLEAEGAPAGAQVLALQRHAQRDATGGQLSRAATQ